MSGPEKLPPVSFDLSFDDIGRIVDDPSWQSDLTSGLTDFAEISGMKYIAIGNPSVPYILEKDIRQARQSSELLPLVQNTRTTNQVINNVVRRPEIIAPIAINDLELALASIKLNRRMTRRTYADVMITLNDRRISQVNRLETVVIRERKVFRWAVGLSRSPSSTQDNGEVRIMVGSLEGSPGSRTIDLTPLQELKADLPRVNLSRVGRIQAFK